MANAPSHVGSFDLLSMSVNYVLTIFLIINVFSTNFILFLLCDYVVFWYVLLLF